MFISKNGSSRCLRYLLRPPPSPSFVQLLRNQPQSMVSAIRSSPVIERRVTTLDADGDLLVHSFWWRSHIDLDRHASCSTFDEMQTLFVVLTINFCRPGKRQQVAFDPPLEPMLAPQRRWETKAAAAAFVHRRLRSRCPETQDDTCGGTVRRG